MSEKINRAVFLEGRELLKRLRVRFPVLFPADRRDLKPWALGEGNRNPASAGRRRERRDGFRRGVARGPRSLVPR